MKSVSKKIVTTFAFLGLLAASTTVMADEQEKSVPSQAEEDSGWTAADFGKGVVIITGAAYLVSKAPKISAKFLEVENRPATFSSVAAATGAGVAAATMMQSDEASAAPAEAELNSEE